MGFSGAQPRAYREQRGEAFLPLVRHHDFAAMGPMAVGERDRSCVLPNTESDP